VKLVDVHPDGKAYNLANGILRARFRHSRSRPQALTPGAIESYDIDVWATSNVFKKGHRIRVEVSSSNFPHFDRNTNKMVDPSWATKADFVAAHQSIYHDAAHPSSIDLPIIPPTREREWIEPPFPTQVGSPRGSVAALLELAPDMLP
jgi:putative CocE/NonD family hydrolase